jgi:hypothetical protein
VAIVTADRAPFLNSTDGRIECWAFAEGESRVSMEVQLPPGFPEERRLGVERYALAAVAAMTDKIGRDE